MSRKLLATVCLLSSAYASFAWGQAQSPARPGQQEELQPRRQAAPEFRPPEESELPDNEFGRMVRLGRDIFIRTDELAKPYVGNGLRCVNCHLDRGRQPNSAPLWAAYGLYPAFRTKTGKVDTMHDRLAGCFQYSMNGKAPPYNSEIMTALVTYQFWLAKGAPTGVELKGRGYPELPPPQTPPSWEAGAQVYEQNCALCHGVDGLGQKLGKQYVFPPLWGSQSYNWGAGMHRINTAAAFIKANMPLGLGGTLSDQQAWDVAYYINAQDRPKDPRDKGNIQAADRTYHDENCLYGEKMRGRVLGAAAKK